MKPTDHAAQREAAILNSVNEGVFTVDQEWRITCFNRAAERITGVSREQAVGSRCCDVFRASICETDCALRKTMSEGHPVVNATAHIVNHEGQRIPIRLSTALLRDDMGAVIGGGDLPDLTQIEQLQKELESRYTFEDIVGRSAAMLRLFDVVPQISASTSTVLIEGASGTGKELFARAITTSRPGAGNRLWPSTAPRCRIPCSRASCSATRPARLRTQNATNRGALRWPTEGPFFWMSSATSPPPCRCGCCGCFRNVRSNRWAVSNRFRSMFGSLPPRTRTSRSWCVRACFATTCITGFAWSI